MKRIVRALTHRWPQAMLLSGAGLALVAIGSLTGCAGLGLPSLTLEPGATNALVPIYTPTLAPVLLTPVPTATAAPASSSSATTTPTFGLPLPEPTCAVTPMWGLGDVWQNGAVRTRLGCPVGEQIGADGEELYFEYGHMLWRPDLRVIYILFERGEAGGWGAVVDTFQPGDAESDSSVVAPTPDATGLTYGQPTGRFGKLWRENGWLRDQLGWAVAGYSDDQQAQPIRFGGAVQDFEGGVLFWNGSACFVLRMDDMSWDMY